MTNNKGFTLIELLIVVLIIGILSSVALPRYRNSIQKAKLAEVDIALSAAKRSMEIYLDANGWPSKDDGKIYFTGNGSIGNVELPGDCSKPWSCMTEYGKYVAFCQTGNCEIEFTGQSIDAYIRMYLRDSVGDFWYVGDIGQNSVALICQWVKERGYPGSSTVVSDCKKAGVQLESIEGGDEGEGD